MKIISINRSSLEVVDINGESVKTGIFKKPLTESVAVTPLGIENDTIVHKNVHGGLDQALYLYSQEDYDWWQNETDRTYLPGDFGENITISRFPSNKIKVGDQLTISEVVLEITAPRIPCATFAYKMGDTKFAKKFTKACRPGTYARVINTGMITQNDSIDYIPTDKDFITTTDFFRQWTNKVPNKDLLAKALNSPISKIFRPGLQEKYDLLIGKSKE